ncbi:hypothetical protein DL239_08920 [Sedimentitalea sp. CY04]|uniref:Uncharacterized protein n=1 Tax=Parasedimentitalea denitrificans TaxID=2211118 RepID=A0ABX0W6A4_9RHOB|nr:hypothetical protein [Sedimentitalea sp. CY04]
MSGLRGFDLLITSVIAFSQTFPISLKNDMRKAGRVSSVHLKLPNPSDISPKSMLADEGKKTLRKAWIPEIYRFLNGLVDVVFRGSLHKKDDLCYVPSVSRQR